MAAFTIFVCLILQLEHCFLLLTFIQPSELLLHFYTIHASVAKKDTENDTPGVFPYYSVPGVEGRVYSSKGKILRIKQ